MIPSARIFEAVVRPVPQAFTDHRVVTHFGVDLGAKLSDKAELSVPAGLRVRVVQDDESA